MALNNVVIIGGGVLGTQIGLMCAYWGCDVTFWLRSESSIARTQPKIERYSGLMLEDLAKAKELIGTPMGAYQYPRGLIKDWEGATPEGIDALLKQAKINFAEKIHIELDLPKALADADIIIESMSEDPKAKIEIYPDTPVPIDIVNKSLQLHGGYGYSQEYEIERLYRDVRIASIYEGSSQVQQMVISGQMLK